MLSAMVYLFVGSSLMPWNQIQQRVPDLGNLLQMPKRISYIAVPFLILATFALYQDLMLKYEKGKLYPVLEVLVGVMAVASIAAVSQTTITNKVNNVKNTSTPVHLGISSDLENVVPQAYKNHPAPKNIKQLQPAFHTSDLEYLIKSVDRATPDYIPQVIKSDDNAAEVKDKKKKKTGFYKLYRDEITLQKNKFKHTVRENGKVTLSWTAKNTKETSIPLVAYKRTQVQVNGREVPSESLKTTRLGNMIIPQQIGKNEVTVRYQMSFASLASKWISLLGWLAIAVWGTVNFWRSKKVISL